jgi:hypothetical protein
MKKIVLEKIQCTLQLNYSFCGSTFFYFDFDITMKYFLSPHFSFSMCDKHNVIISKVHTESILLFKLIHNF